MRTFPPPATGSRWISELVAAQTLGVGRPRIRTLVGRGELAGDVIDGKRYVNEASVAAYARARLQAGEGTAA